MLHAFVAALGNLLEWRKMELNDGRVGMVLFFDLTRWEVTADLELLPKES
jgi:hypothetical protein